MAKLSFRPGDTNVQVRFRLVKRDGAPVDIAGRQLFLEFVDRSNNVVGRYQGVMDVNTGEVVFTIDAVDNILGTVRAFVVIEDPAEGYRESSEPISVSFYR